MKNIKTLAVAGVLVTSVCAFAFAHAHLGSARLHGARGQFTDTASAVQHLAEMFPNFAAFDANKDGQFDAAEKESLTRALADGTLQLPAHRPPDGVVPDAAAMLSHIGEMYAQVARYDANHDGSLDASEQAVINIAIEKGELAWPPGGGQRHH